MDVRQLIQEYLSKAQMMHIATSHDNHPWAATTYFAADIDMNLYWMSKASRRHSQEISKNSKVARTIVLPHNYGEKVRGIQFEGEARELKGDDLQAGRNIFSSRYWIVGDTAGLNSDPDPLLCYQVKPNLIVLFDEVNFPDNPRQELKI